MNLIYLVFQESCIFIGQGNFAQAETVVEGDHKTEEGKQTQQHFHSLKMCWVHCFLFCSTDHWRTGTGLSKWPHKGKGQSFGGLPHFLPAFQQRESATFLIAMRLPLNSLTWDFGVGVREERLGMEKQTPVPTTEFKLPHNFHGTNV